MNESIRRCMPLQCIYAVPKQFSLYMCTARGGTRRTKKNEEFTLSIVQYMYVYTNLVWKKSATDNSHNVNQPNEMLTKQRRCSTSWIGSEWGKPISEDPGKEICWFGLCMCVCVCVYVYVNVLVYVQKSMCRQIALYQRPHHKFLSVCHHQRFCAPLRWYSNDDHALYARSFASYVCLTTF